MSEQLQPNGNPVRVGGVTLRTPGLAGVATSYLAAAANVRSATRTTDELEQALQSQGLRTMETVEIAGTREVPTGAAHVRSTSYDEPALEVEVADPGEQWGQVVLYTDEAGVTKWAFARDPQGALDATRGRSTRTYVISRRVAPAAVQPGTRGLVGALGKKVLKVLVFPIVDPVLGEVGEHFAARWEQAKRPYRLRGFTPDGFTSAAAAPLSSQDLQRLSQGPALMLVHGTFSRAHTAFGGMTSEYVAELARRYEGRIFAFDHFTLSEDPRRNVDWLLQALPDAIKLDLDVICHSRGGLVSRVLAESQGELNLGSREIKVGRVVFVAAPNAGTTLADAQHLGDLVDSYTNILNFFPDNGVTETIEAIVTVVKQVAVAAFKGLEGLQSMKPGGEFLTSLNHGPAGDSRYYALASNFEPKQESGLAGFAKDLLFDKLFNADNDLVVPTSGVWDANGSARFPIADRRVFEAGDSIQHGGFFSDARARQQILDWLRP